jgi:DNA invertase Pin-like site-specific DNA recombinase
VNAGRPRRAAFYLRVSKEQQNTENQRPGLEQMAQVRRLEVVKVYDEKESAAKTRPKFDQMVRDAHRGEFDVILVWALDRFGRSLVKNVQDVMALDRRGVQVISYMETWLELDGSQRGLLLSVFSWFAESERARLIERTNAGLARAVASGKKLGRPRARVNVAEARRLLEEQSKTQKQAAKLLGVSLATLERALAQAREEEAATPAGTCVDCGAAPGSVHGEGCELEQCATCRGPRLACACRKRVNSHRVPWGEEKPSETVPRKPRAK